MPEYESSLPVNAPPERVFDFVSDVRNMPQYLPTAQRAEPEGEGRVRIQGQVKGHSYDSDGWLRADRTEWRLEWGSDGENRYRGWMEIECAGDQSLVTVHLSFEPRPDEARRMEQNAGSPDAAIQQGLDAALASLRNILQGQGSKVEPSSTR